MAAGVAIFAISATLPTSLWNRPTAAPEPAREHAGTLATLTDGAVEETLEFTESEIDGTRVIDAKGAILVSRTRINEGADVTIRSEHAVAFGNGFQIGSQARIAVGGRTIDQPRQHRGVQGG